MNHEENPQDIHSSIEPGLEARVVAWVLGETSEFEAAELERLCGEKPEVAVFKRRVAAVHGLVGEAVRPEPQPLLLAPARRAKVLAAIGGARVPRREALEVLERSRRQKRPIWMRVFYVGVGSAAACLTVIMGFYWMGSRYSGALESRMMMGDISSAAGQIVAGPLFSNPAEDERFEAAPPLIEAKLAREEIEAKRLADSILQKQVIGENNRTTAGANARRRAAAERREADSAAREAESRVARKAEPAAPSHVYSVELPRVSEGLAEEDMPDYDPADGFRDTSSYAGEVTVPVTRVGSISVREPPESVTASETLAGSRIAPSLADVGSAISVITHEEFMRDTAGQKLGPVLNYSTGTEMGSFDGDDRGVGGSAAVRVRGLAEADNSRHYLLEDAPWNSDSETRIGRSTEPNSILFGVGPPAQMTSKKEQTVFPLVESAGESSAEVGKTKHGVWAFSYLGSNSEIDGRLEEYKRAAESSKSGYYDALIANLYYATSRPEEALAYAEKAVAKGGLKRPIPMSLFTAFLAYEQKRFDLAVQYLRQAEALMPTASEREKADYENLKRAIDTAGAAAKPEPPPPIEETAAATEPVSTFSLHVSDVSFRLAQAALERGEMPEPERIRPEEFYNAFDYGDPAPAVADKVSCRIEQAAHPLLQQRNLVRIALRVPATGRGAGTPLQLTVLLDTSGSMEREDRAASVRAAMTVLASLLGPNDRITLIGFARQPRLLEEDLPGDRAAELVDLVDRTPAEGGTNLEEALNLAAELAMGSYEETAQNRVVLLTDGAANLGDADPERLADVVESLRREGIAFDACGVGTDGLDDAVLEALTRQGDGRYYVLDSPAEADAGFARQLAGAFRPAAQNVKVQVRFNPARVGRYRLIGFEQHRLHEEDFRDDKVDAAELAAEEAAVALYQVEVLPEGEGELGEVYVRFRDTSTSAMVERSWTMIHDARAPAFDRATPSMQLAGTAALLAEKLRGGAAGEAVRLEDLAGVVNAVRGAHADDSRVQELVAMFDRMRRLGL